MNVHGSLQVSAPGKVILIGEYAALDRSVAVVMAVNRYVRLARSPEGCRNGGRLVAFARSECGRKLALDVQAGDYRADSSAFFQHGIKLGLGSSGAVVACAVASVFCESNRNIEDQSIREEIWRVACEIHNSFQGVRGSGIDLAASIFGNLMAVVRNEDEEDEKVPAFSRWPMPEGLQLIFLWTGRPASTPRLLKAVDRFRRLDPAGYSRIVSQMKTLAGVFVADGTRQAEDLLEAFDRYAVLMEELGRSSKAPIVTDKMKSVIKMARRMGGTAKPSGAGGGDLVLAAFPHGGNVAKFQRCAEQLGLVRLDLTVAPRGIQVTED